MKFEDMRRAGKMGIDRTAMGEASAARMCRILIADDDPIAAESLAEFLAEQGHSVATAFDGEEALAMLADAAKSAAGADRFGIVVCDMSMPKLSGMETLRRIASEFPSVVVLMLSGYGSIETAVEAVRAGAADYLTKPVVDTELAVALQRALRQHALLAENEALKDRVEKRFGLDSIVGGDHRMVRIFELVQAVAPNKTTVLMTGESGVGKSLIAGAIHQMSPRRDKPFVEISCGSIPETLLESELFGHVKGAFTGAHADKPGRFLAANGGTLFLDEINSASPGMQLKLLRVLQERRFEPVGGNQTTEVDVRIILATNQPLEQLVAEGRFRQDLYYRINVVKIEVPPLRERIADIKTLAEHFLRVHGGELGRILAGFSADALAALQRYSFPGNVRELSNIVERAVVLSRGNTVQLDDLPGHVVANAAPFKVQRTDSAAGLEELPMTRPMEGSGASESRVMDITEGPWTPMPLEEALKEPERKILLKALRANQWNRQRTAEILGINRTTLYKKMKQLGIEFDPAPAAP